MEDVHVLYSMVVGGNELLPQNDPEIRHISFYLWELLFKDYNEIKTEAKELNAEDQNARTVLHKLVEDSMPGAMKNIRTISGIVNEVGNLAKSVLEIQNISAKISTYNTDNASESECSLRDSVVDSLNRNNGDCLNVLVDLYHEILQVTDRERIPLLIAYEGLIQDLSNVQDGTVVKVLKDNVYGLKRKLEQELYESFSNNINDTLKIFADMRIIGLSSDEQIALGYVTNRSKYLLERLKAVEAMFDENVHRGIHELALTFKTMIYSILSCYKLVFGSVDANLRCHMRKTVFQFLAILKQSIETAPKSQLLPKHLAEIKQEMQEISHSFETFGLSFAPLLQEVFAT